MKKLKIMTVLILGVGLMALCGIAYAQAENPEPEQQNEYGVVEKLSDDQIVVSSYDIEQDAMVSIDYVITEQLQAAMKENPSAQVKVGDSVKIKYIVKDGKKVITGIAIKKPQETQE